MVELRWVVPQSTTTAPPRLQYRNWGEWPAGAGSWTDVPFVVVPDAEWDRPATERAAIAQRGKGE